MIIRKATIQMMRDWERLRKKYDLTPTDARIIYRLKKLKGVK